MEANKERREMTQQQQQQQQHQQAEPVELPAESSPYVSYKDLEDYKMKGYGTQGHQQPVDLPHGGGGTDAPTLSGSGLSAEREALDADPVRRLGVP